MIKFALNCLILFVFAATALSGCSKSKSKGASPRNTGGAVGSGGASGGGESTDGDPARSQGDADFSEEESRQVPKGDGSNNDGDDSEEASQNTGSGQINNKIRSKDLWIGPGSPIGSRVGTDIIHTKSTGERKSVSTTSGPSGSVVTIYPRQAQVVSATSNDMHSSDVQSGTSVVSRTSDYQPQHRVEIISKAPSAQPISTPFEQRNESLPAVSPQPAPSPHQNPRIRRPEDMTVKGTPKEERIYRSLRAPLQVKVYFLPDLENNTSKYDRKVVKQFENIIEKSDLENARRTTIVENDVYNRGYHITVGGDSYIPQKVFDGLRNQKVCDLNTVGACVVYERDTFDGITQDKVYVLAGASTDDSNYEYRVVRQEVKLGLFQKPRMLDGKEDGIYILTQAASFQDAMDQYNGLNSKPTAPASECSGPKDMNDPNEISAFDRMMARAKKLFTRNKTKANAGNGTFFCHIEAELKLVRRFFILDRITKAPNVDGIVDYSATKTSVGNNNFLYCENGDVKQKVRIVVNDFQKYRLGFATSRVTQKMWASGGGWANGALDIMTIREYDYGTQFDFQALVSGFSWTPLILSIRGDKQPIFAGQVGFVKPSFMFLNVNFSFAGWYQIGFDPSDTALYTYNKKTKQSEATLLNSQGEQVHWQTDKDWDKR